MVIDHVSFSLWGRRVEARLISKGELVGRDSIPTVRVKHPLRKALRWLRANHPTASYSYIVERGACAPVSYE